MKYYVYMLRCRDNTYYTGITNDLKQRVRAHNTLRSGARYTRSRRPVRLIYYEEYPTKSEALKRECAIKSMPRRDKECLLETDKSPVQNMH